MSQMNNNAGSVIDSVINDRFGKYKEENEGGAHTFCSWKDWALALVEGVATKRWISVVNAMKLTDSND